MIRETGWLAPVILQRGLAALKCSTLPALDLLQASAAVLALC